MKSFKLIRNINNNVINYIFNLFAFSIINVTVHRLVLYHLYTVLCGVEVRALACRSQHSGFNVESTKIIFLIFINLWNGPWHLIRFLTAHIGITGDYILALV